MILSRTKVREDVEFKSSRSEAASSQASSVNAQTGWKVML